MVDVSIKVTVSGGPSLEEAVLNAFSQFRPELKGVITEEAEEIMAASKLIVPFDEGTLSRSGGMYGSVSDGSGEYVRFGYGGAASSYAKVQHETPPHIFSHADGRSWKYLERPVFEAVTTMPGRLASRLSARLAARFGGGAGGGDGTTFGS